jgi:hypothetical protein
MDSILLPHISSTLCSIAATVRILERLISGVIAGVGVAEHVGAAAVLGTPLWHAAMQLTGKMFV